MELEFILFEWERLAMGEQGISIADSQFQDLWFLRCEGRSQSSSLLILTALTQWHMSRKALIAEQGKILPLFKVLMSYTGYFPLQERSTGTQQTWKDSVIGKDP